MPKGAGFSRRLRGVQDQPGPENVERTDGVGVLGQAAPHAAELGLAGAVLRAAMPTRRASAGGVAGVDCDQLSVGALSLTREDSQEHPQPASRIARFSPAFCATFRPGWSSVPDAERDMLPIRYSREGT